jgi:hypothetical protein
VLGETQKPLVDHHFCIVEKLTRRIEMRHHLTFWLAMTAVSCAAEPPLQTVGTGDAFVEIDNDCCDAGSGNSFFDSSEQDESELVMFKKQALQSFAVSAGWQADSSGDGLSGSFLDVSIGSGIPLGNFENILGIRPRFRIDWVDTEPTVDVPRELYEFELQFFYRRPIHDRLSAMAIFSPSIRSDLTTSDNAFRVFALALLNWEWIPDRLTLSGGAVYLGRADLPVLPAVGLAWTPNRFTRLDLRFPSSRLSYRLAKDGARSETWVYAAAGIGGNTWAVTRDSSITDELSLRDFRLTFGVEKLVAGGGGWFAETGCAFNRQIEFEKDDTDLDFGNGILIAGGWRY